MSTPGWEAEAARRRRITLTGAAAALVALAVMLAVTPRAGAAVGEPITFGEVTCAPHWAAPNPGLDRFVVVNDSSHTATVYLFHADSGVIVATVRRSTAGSVHPLTVRLSPGVYAWGCDLDDLPRHVSEAVRVTAHVTWLTIGQDDGAYGAFGDLGRQIDGTAAGLVGGTGNPRFSGFHKVELDLWRRSDPGAAAGDAQHLGRLVAQLQAPGALAAALPATRAG